MTEERRAIAKGMLAWLYPEPGVPIIVGDAVLLLPCKLCPAVLGCAGEGRLIAHQVLVRHRNEHQPDGHDYWCYCTPCVELRMLRSVLQ